MGRIFCTVVLGILLSGCASSERLFRLTSRDPVASYKAPASERLQQGKWQSVVQKTNSLREKSLQKNGQTDLFEETDVNVWPFFTRSNLYTSILWPFIDYDPYGMAIRPFYNQEGDEYSVLFPLSAWNPATGDGWVLNTFWNKDHVIVVPLGAWSDNFGWVLNCYWSKNQKQELDSLGAFPLFHYSPERLWVGPFTKSETSVALLPLFYYSSQNGMALNVLIFSQFNRDKEVTEQRMFSGIKSDSDWILLYYNGDEKRFSFDHKLNSNVTFYLENLLNDMARSQKTFEKELPRLELLLQAIGIEEKAPENPAAIAAFRRMIVEKYGKFSTNKNVVFFPLFWYDNSAYNQSWTGFPFYFYRQNNNEAADTELGQLNSITHLFLFIAGLEKTENRVWKYDSDCTLSMELDKLYNLLTKRHRRLEEMLALQYQIKFQLGFGKRELNKKGDKEDEELFYATSKKIGLELKYPQTPQECNQMIVELFDRYGMLAEMQDDLVLLLYSYKKAVKSEKWLLFPLWGYDKEYIVENGERNLTESSQFIPFILSFSTNYQRYLSDRNAEKALKQIDELERCDNSTPVQKREELTQSLTQSLAKLPENQPIPENLLGYQALREKLQQRYQYEEKHVSNVLYPLLSWYSEDNNEKSLCALLGGLYYFNEERDVAPVLGEVSTDLSPLLVNGRKPIAVAEKEYNHVPLLLTFSGSKTYLEYKDAESAQKIAKAKAENQLEKVLRDETVAVESGRRMFLLGSYVDSYYGDNYKFNLLGLLASGYSNADSSEFSILEYFYRYRRNDSGKAWMIFPFVSCKTGVDKSKFSFLWRLYSQETRGDKTRYHLFFIPFGDQLSEEAE